jgi:hypothetical protein
MRFEVLMAVVLKSCIFWDIRTRPSKKPGSACRLLRTGSLLGLFLETEDERNMFSETSVDFQRATRHVIPEERTPRRMNYYIVNVPVMSRSDIWPSKTMKNIKMWPICATRFEAWNSQIRRSARPRTWFKISLAMYEVRIVYYTALRF